MRRNAGITLNPSPIESYDFSDSKLYSNFFSNSDSKIFYVVLKKMLSGFWFLWILVRVSIVNPIRIYYRNPYQNPKGAKIPNFFFQIDVENLFLRVGKKLEMHIDQKIHALSIAAIFKAIRALLPCKPAKT